MEQAENLYERLCNLSDPIKRIIWGIIDIVLLYFTGFLISITEKGDWALIMTIVLFIISFITILLRVIFDEWDF